MLLRVYVVAQSACAGIDIWPGFIVVIFKILVTLRGVSLGRRCNKKLDNMSVILYKAVTCGKCSGKAGLTCVFSVIFNQSAIGFQRPLLPPWS